MKAYLTALLFIATATTPLLSSGQTGDLTVIVTNISEAKGKILIGLYDNEKQFKKDGNAPIQAQVEVKSKTFKYTFKNIPYKEYGIALQQDLNNDGEFNQNAIGWPLEPYGFSNNVKPFLSMPAFEKVKFKFNGSKSVTIELTNT